MDAFFSTVSAVLRRQPKWVIPSAVTGVALLIGGSAYLVHAYRRQTSQPVLVPVSQSISPPAPATPVPTTAPVANLLNGLPGVPGTESTHPLAVMIENHPDARPQSGLGSADEVVEAIAEGGITRFMAVYAHPNQPVSVGPIRSARPYYVSFAQEVKAIYAHAGGSKDALDILNGYPYNLDGLVVGAPTFTRDFSRKVSLEHTLYSSTDKLWSVATANNHWPTVVQYPSLLFTDAAAAADRPAAQHVSVSVSEPLYAVSWEYDPGLNAYRRSMAGTPHIDLTTSKQITASTVVLQTVGRTPYTENYSGGVSKTVYYDDLTSGGKAVVIENGKAILGTWEVSNGRTRYVDTSRAEIALVRGTLWIHLVHDDSAISY